MTMAQPNQPSKAMSSRLLTMKFMQRAAASTSSPPSTPPEPPAKKQRISNGSYNSVSSTPHSEPQAVDEAPQSKGRETAATNRGETKWYLSFKEPHPRATDSPLRVISTGYATVDSSEDRSLAEDEDANDTPQIQGRRSFGKFNRKVEKQQDPELSSSSDSDASDSDSSQDNNEEDDGASDDPTGAKAMIAQSRKEAGDKVRAERRARKYAVKAEAERMAEQRREKRVKLNPQVTSISGTGGSGANPSLKMAY